MLNAHDITDMAPGTPNRVIQRPTLSPPVKMDLSKGVKLDAEKPRMDLLDSSWLEGVAQILTFGAKKYAAHNWRNGIELSRLIAAALRHISRFNDGENCDPETGKSHLYHASCCLMFATWMLNNRPDLDDRYKGK